MRLALQKRVLLDSHAKVTERSSDFSVADDLMSGTSVFWDILGAEDEIIHIQTEIIHLQNKAFQRQWFGLKGIKMFSGFFVYVSWKHVIQLMFTRTDLEMIKMDKHFMKKSFCCELWERNDVANLYKHT